ncbi:ankyrin [Xylaria telfairii]|nr:ankyrin [Xylaria telfairii]
MDPLSVTASVIALVQAAVGISKGVRFLRSFGQIPFEFGKLLNELSTLHAVIGQVETALRDWEDLRPTTSNATRFKSVDARKVLPLKDELVQVISELDNLCDRLKVPKKQGEKSGCDEPKSVSKLRWQKEKGNIVRLRNKARRSRELLTLSFSAFGSSQAQQHTKVTLDIQEMLCTATENILRLQNKNTKTEEGSQAILKELQGSINQIKHDLSNRKPLTSTEETNNYLKYGLVNDDLSTNRSLLTSKSMIQFQAVLVRGCSSTCNCNCHQMKQSRSPGWLGTFIGNLFLQYNTSPVFQRHKCDKLTCIAKSPSSVRLYYVFPYWLLARSIELHASWSSLVGPGSSLHIRVPRVLGSHWIWRAIRFNDIRWVQIHLANKSFLATDVDRCGRSLAAIALSQHRFELAKFFAQQGSDIHSKDAFGHTATSIARITGWKIYTSPITIHNLDTSKNLLEAFSLQHQMRETVQSSRVHQAILQGRDELLVAFIEADSSEVNQLDGFGYAPLHWAVYRRKSNLVRVLLESGAAPDTLSSAGYAPLHIAAAFKDIDSAQLLLESGANANLSNPFNGKTAIFAAYGYATISRLLLSYGAQLGIESIDGIRTPLDDMAEYTYDWTENEECRSRWTEWLYCLLSAGLNIDNKSGQLGATPIMLSLSNRNAILLDLLIVAGARLDLVDSDQNGILHYAAMSTTTESIEILRRAKISGINPDRPNVYGETPLGWLACRMYVSDENLLPGERRVTTDEFWGLKTLVDEIRQRNREKRRLDLTIEEPYEDINEIEAGMEVASDGIDSVIGWWGGSSLSDDHGVISARSTSSGSDGFFDCEDENSS